MVSQTLVFGLGGRSIYLVCHKCVSFTKPVLVDAYRFKYQCMIKLPEKKIKQMQ